MTRAARAADSTLTRASSIRTVAWSYCPNRFHSKIVSRSRILPPAPATPPLSYGKAIPAPKVGSTASNWLRRIWTFGDWNYEALYTAKSIARHARQARVDAADDQRRAPPRATRPAEDRGQGARDRQAARPGWLHAYRQRQWRADHRVRTARAGHQNFD